MPPRQAAIAPGQPARSSSLAEDRIGASTRVSVPSLHARTRGPAGHAVDGRLALWQELKREQAWRDLLVGNGLSSHIWPAFAYRSLYAQACEAGLLGSSDRMLFAAGATENFEGVLGALAVSIRTLDALAEPAVERLRMRHLRIQQALGAAVMGVHVPLSALPASTRAAVRATLRDYRWVFTTSYDLVLYWCAGYGESFDGFADFFFCNERLEFDPAKTVVERDATRLVYLHGALHLLVDAMGVARKRRSRDATLLEQFRKPASTDPLTRPLLVAEGSAREKARAIRANDYLSFGQQQLRHRQGGLVIFGLSLREEDAHLARALNCQPQCPIAVGMRPHAREENRRRQARVRQLLDAEELYFFDSRTHPLGDPALAAAALEGNDPTGDRQ